MKRYEASRSPCPIGRASRVVGDRWVLLILRETFLGVSQFEDLKNRLPISRAALSSRLALMIDAGLLFRDPPDAKRAAYILTESGKALSPVLAAIGTWSAQHLFDPDDPPRNWRSPG
ncbi:helix-turn-helix domain-containing protein [Pontixanthobacter aestiaquae]|uniref:Transcriptional regulator n=1 Tax=Pontixanthobacter aestiaquae TaxID=1509367 RepID=A0A844Z554_9SPHN|nr:helix-turn-helix domain-containing protein [Pontixanthobacter aestiaquae]MDN3646791.1 helix-turn-helix domain-containing protein [Pontixanthobacter aestiaquae]MXO82227.1 transcriptional regulator [Pontixanthobacter aestiaquae]